MKNFTPSKYQKAVYAYIKFGHGNAIIDAVAGSGKSTTIVNALKIIPASKKVLFLAFNKAIVEELKIKIGNLSNVSVKTLHSLGASSVMKEFHSAVDSEKYSFWLNQMIKLKIISLPANNSGNWKSNVLKIIDLGRVNLVKDFENLSSLVYKHEIDINSNEIEIAIKGIEWGEKETSVIDFTDMIYFPNVKNIKMRQYDYVFIDECQDLNAAQRELFLKCLKPEGRFVAVGDPRQAIYGFAGADIESFNILKSLPHTVRLPLSVCYRCDSKIIALAKEIVPQIEARKDADEGVISNESSINDVQSGDMVLCRISAPLVSLCMNYISRGIKAYVKGKDIGVNLINLIKRAKCNTIEDSMEKIRKELGKIIGKVVAKQKCSEAEAKKSSMYRNMEDKINTLDILSFGLTTSEELINRIEVIFSDNKEGICLSTVHKSKGLESDKVFILCQDKFYLPTCMDTPWMAEQETNLVYVAITRAKHFLGYINDFNYGTKN